MLDARFSLKLNVDFTKKYCRLSLKLNCVDLKSTILNLKSTTFLLNQQNRPRFRKSIVDFRNEVLILKTDRFLDGKNIT